MNKEKMKNKIKKEKLEIKLSELKSRIKQTFKKGDVLSGFEVKKAIENLFERIEILEQKKLIKKK